MLWSHLLLVHLYAVVTFTASSLVLFFNLLLSKYVHYLFNQPCTCKHSKQILNYFAVSERFFYIVNVILALYTAYKDLNFLGVHPNPTPEPPQIPVDFQYAFCVTQRLGTQSHNYRPTEKTLFVALSSRSHSENLQNLTQDSEISYETFWY